MEDDAVGEPRGLSTEALERNGEFRRFTERMRGMRRAFTVKSKGDVALRVVIPPPDNEAVQGVLSGEWLDCCLREYLERKRLFDNRFHNRAQLIARIVVLLVPFLVLLWSIWPMWRVLIDVETDAYYKALEVPSTATPSEITRAYRAMMKRWHPDKNPACGHYCREKTERIKEAYDMLLSRNNHRLTLANQYHEGLMSLRSLLPFRGFQMSGNAAMNVFMILLRVYPESTRRSQTVRLACSVIVLTFCTVHETLFVSGFNLVIVVELFYYSLRMAKVSAQEESIEEVRRNSYFDVVHEAFVLLGCASLASVAACWRGNTAMSIEEASRMLYGSVYVLSFLYKFSPNVYDNFLMRKCSLPLTYLDMSSARFTWTRFAASELMFLVDDLFVFTCRISSPYRVVVYIAHFVALCQFFMLPWDAPIINVRSSARARAAGMEEVKVPTSVSVGDRVAQSTNKNAVATVEQNAFLQSYMTKEEESIVSDLDREAVSWMDIARLKYQTLIFTLGQTHAKQYGQSADFVDIVPCSDLQNVLFVAFNRGTGTRPDESEKRFKVLRQLCDPEISRLLAMERGPRMMAPARPKSMWDLQLARMEYFKGLGSLAPLTSSQVWRRRRGESRSVEWKAVGTMVCASVVLAIVCAATGPSSHDVVRSSKGIDSSLRPQLFARFLGALPPTHFVNALSGGLLTVAQIPLCTLDWLDVGVSLGFVR